jgi:hypothetical protein
MPDYRVLVVAPKTELVKVDDEVMQVVNLLRATELRGYQATLHGLLEILSQPFNLVWFATHGSEKGILLNDDYVNASELTSLLRSASVEGVIFNTCSSKSVALTIYDELRIPMVCTLKAVPDRTAFVTGTILARKLAEGATLRQAYNQAKPGQNQTYLYLPQEWEEEVEMPPLEVKPQGFQQSDITSIMNLVKRLEILVSGNADYNVPGLIATVNKLDIKVSLIMEEFQAIKANQRFSRILLLSLTIICVLFLIGMFLLALKSGVL